MKRRSSLICLSAIVLVFLCGFFSWSKEKCAAPIPEASHPGGYYEDPFLLELSAPANGAIFYTTDGSIPTEESTLYKNGIFLKNRCDEPNHYNAIKNVVTDWKEYLPGSSSVDKGTVVRAIYINSLGIASEIFTQTYFIGVPQPEQGYTLSLSFVEEDLFGENGIYITGTEYDTWYLSSDRTDPAPAPNFQKRLIVPANAELMDENGTVLNQTVSLRLQGNSARSLPKKRFILEADANYVGSNLFPAEIFPNTVSHSVMTKEFPSDALIADLVSDRAVAAQRSVPISVYLNGEFWYDCFLLERYDNQYFRQHFDTDNVILVKNSVVDTNSLDIDSGYGDLLDWVNTTDFSDPEQWEQLNREVDIQSYIDFIAINYYLCNFDFDDYKNHVMWRSAYEEASAYADQRWRWCIYDIDPIQFATERYDVENAAEVNIFSWDFPHTETKLNETIFFRSLRKNEEFNKQFVLSFMDMVNCNFSPDHVTPVLEKNDLTMNWMDGFFLKRPAYAARHLAEEFGLTGSLETVSITTEQPALGTVIVNTSTVDLADGSWTGSYFTDFPITVTAVPNEGCEFLGWKGDADSSNHSLTQKVDGGIRLEAVFAKSE